MTEFVKVEPAIEIQVTFGPDGGRSFGMRFAPMPLDTGRTTLDEVLDRVLDAVERQRARFSLIDKEAQLQQLVAIIRKNEGSLVLVEEAARARWVMDGKKGEWTPDKMPAAEAMKKQHTEVGLQRDRATAEALTDEITKLRRLVNGYASYSGADRNPG